MPDSLARRLVIVGLVGAIGVAGWFFVLHRGSNPCDVLAEHDLIDVVSDFDSSNARPSMESAVQLAFSQAGMPRQINSSDLDPVVKGSGNVVHVGADGYWIMLATVTNGFVVVDGPRPCSTLDS